MEESNLILGLQKRDEEAFIQIVELYKKKIISLCYSFTEDYQEAEDISQEVFIALYNSIGAFQGKSSLSTYIYKVTINRCLDFKRKKSIKNFLSGLIETNKENVIDDDEKSYVRSCIRKLPIELRTPIVLYYYIGLSQKEIAEIIGITSKNVEGKIYRGKQKLKIEFQKEGYELCSKNGTI